MIPLLLAALVVQETPLDQRRRIQLQQADAAFELAAPATQYPMPNYSIKPDGEMYCMEKVLAIFGLVNLGVEPTSRIEEANRILRYMISKWPANTPNDFNGWSTSVWRFRGKSMGTRLYLLYHGYFQPDIKQEFLKRFDWLCQDPFNNSSYNIRTTNNNARLLAHEITGKTNLASYASNKAWWKNFLKKISIEGNGEWAGQEYAGWTLGSILNVAEFCQDAEVKKLATMALDYLLAQTSGFQIQSGFCSTGNRWKTQWLFGDIPVQTFVTHVLFLGGSGGGEWNEWAASNYRPLSAVADLYANGGPLEARMTQENLRIRNYRGAKYSISTMQMPDNVTGWHDLVSVYVKSAKEDASYGFPFGTPPTGSTNSDNGYLCVNGRSFGYKNVALVRLGGKSKKAMSSVVVQNVPLRFYHRKAFTAEFQNGWAFLTDGVTYVAWKPGTGVAQADPDSAEFTKTKFGYWLKSSHIPDEFGEFAAIEVGDAALFGSYAGFKNDVLARNPNVTGANGQIVYQSKDGAVLVLGAEFATVNGVAYDPTTHPRAKMPGLDHFTLTNAGITFNFNAGTVSGTQTRLPVNHVFGVTGPPSLAITTGATLPGGNQGMVYSKTLTASGGTPPYATWVKIWGTLPPGLALNGPTISGTPSVQGTYSFRIRVYDSAGAITSRLFSLTIGPPVPLAITTAATLPSGNKGLPYSKALTATGGTGVYPTWVKIWGTMPPGISLNGNVLTGTPTAAGTWTFRIRVFDSSGAVTSRLFTMTVQP